MLKLKFMGSKIKLSVVTFCFTNTEIDQIKIMIEDMKNKINEFIYTSKDSYLYNTILLGYINNANVSCFDDKITLFDGFKLDNSNKSLIEINTCYEKENDIN